MFKVNDTVKIKNTNSNLDGLKATILGTYGDYAEVMFFILLFDRVIDNKGSIALVMISSCLEKVDL